MNGFLNTGFEFWHLISLMATTIVGITVLRLVLKFDINKHLERRSKLLASRLINACTHIEIRVNDNKEIEGTSLYVSPPGTVQWQCQRCGHLTYDMNRQFDRQLSFFVDNIDVYHEKNEKFLKLLKKSGQL